jgi:hypothetical protein
MPIDYRKYPKNWKTEIRPAILDRAKHCCEFCGVPNYSVGYRDKGGVFVKAGRSDKYKVFKIVLTVAHLNHDITDNRHENLRALCQRCHLHYDKEHHKQSRIKNKQSEVRNGNSE